MAIDEGARVTLTLRDLSPAEAEAAATGLGRVAVHGFPNYVDVARLGPARATGEFPAKHLVAGDPERALRLLAAALPPGQARTIAGHLAAHPRDFTGAFERLPAHRRAGVLAAWQAALWNRIVAAWLGRRLGPAAIPVVTPWHRLVRWDVPSDALAAALEGLAVPLPRHDAAYADEWRELAADVLGSEGVTVEGMFPRRLRATEFPAGDRPLRVRPHEAVADAPVADDGHPGRLAVTLRFALPPGSDATMLERCLGLDAPRRARTVPVGPRRAR